MNFVKNLFDRKIELSNKDILNITITAVYALITLILVAHHEPFEDELNVWMILNNFSGFQLFERAFEGGNSLIMYLIMWPFAKAGFSYYCVRIVCWLSCVLAVFVLNCLSPFPLFINAIITFSAPMLYFYPVIARSYSLLPLFLFSAAFFFSDRNIDKDGRNIGYVLFLLLLAAISMTHVIMFAFVALMLFLFVYQRFYLQRRRHKSEIAASAITLASLTIIVVQVLVAMKAVSQFGNKSTVLAPLKGVLIPFFACFFDTTKGNIFYSYTPNSGLLFYLPLFVAIILFCGMLIFLYRREKKYFWIFLLSVCFPLYIYLTTYSIIVPYRVFTVHLLLVFFFWTAVKNNNETSIKMLHNKLFLTVMSLFFLISVPSGFSMAYSDLKQNFSSAINAAEYIKKNIPDDGKNILISPFPWEGAAVAFYLAPRAIYLLNGEKVMCIEDRPGALENRLAESGILAGREWLYVVASIYHFETLASLGYEFVYITPKSMVIEDHYVIFRKKLYGNDIIDLEVE